MRGIIAHELDSLRASSPPSPPWPIKHAPNTAMEKLLATSPSPPRALSTPFVSVRRSSLTFSTCSFLLGEGVGGIFLPPVSESFGRKFVYIAAPLICSVFCVMVAAVPPQLNGSVALLIFARFAAGMVSSVPATVAPGSLEDMFDEEQRIWTVSAWTTASNVGVLFGPIYGSYVTAYLGW